MTESRYQPRMEAWLRSKRMDDLPDGWSVDFMCWIADVKAWADKAGQRGVENMRVVDHGKFTAACWEYAK